MAETVRGTETNIPSTCECAEQNNTAWHSKHAHFRSTYRISNIEKLAYSNCQSYKCQFHFAINLRKVRGEQNILPHRVDLDGFWAVLFLFYSVIGSQKTIILIQIRKSVVLCSVTCLDITDRKSVV